MERVEEKMNKKGISMIVLIIMIAVFLILLVTVILTAKNERISDRAREAAFKATVLSYKEQLDDYIANQEFINSGRFDAYTVNFDTSNIRTAIPDIAEWDEEKYIVKEGKLVYVHGNAEEKAWSEQVLK